MDVGGATLPIGRKSVQSWHWTNIAEDGTLFNSNRCVFEGNILESAPYTKSKIRISIIDDMLMPITSLETVQAFLIRLLIHAFNFLIQK